MNLFPSNARRAGALLTVVLGLSAAAAQAAPTTYDLRGYFDSLSDPYPTQQATNLWTFHRGDHSGTLLPAYGADYYDYGNVLYQQIGSKLNVGEGGCSPGFCPANPAQSLATFNGVFVHPGSSSATSAVFHIQQDATLDEVKLWSETVGNGNNGNGFDVQVRAIIGGQAQALVAFLFDFAGTRNTKDEHVVAPGLSLHAGDMIEILYGNNGGYLYDHGNIEAFITLSPGTGGGGTVPEPAGTALACLGLTALSLLRRRQGSRKEPCRM